MLITKSLYSNNVINIGQNLKSHQSHGMNTFFNSFHQVSPRRKLAPEWGLVSRVEGLAALFTASKPRRSTPHGDSVA